MGDHDLDSIDDADPGSGSKLRRIIEQLSAENRSLKEVAVSSKAENVIRDKGYTFVKVTDLVGVGLEDLDAKAEELEEARRSDFESTLRARGEANGLSGDDLETFVSQFVSGTQPAQQSTTAVPDAVDRTRQTTSQATNRPPAVNPANLTPLQKLEKGLK